MKNRPRGAGAASSGLAGDGQSLATGEPTARRRWTQAALAELDNQIVAVLAEDWPQSVRHVFYRMTDPRLAAPVPKTEDGYRRVQRRCLELRRGGVIPYGWIVDATRRGHFTPTYGSGGEFVAAMASAYRGTLWTADLPLVEVWAESRSIAATLESECRRLAVALYPSGGFASDTLVHEAAEDIDRRDHDRAVVLYVGDFDPAGVLIDRDIEDKLRGHLTTPLEFRRLAINREQIAAFDLPTKPRKATDRRRPDIAETVEAEAMPAATLRGIVAGAVESYLPTGALAATKAAEESERRYLKTLGAVLQKRKRADFTARAP